MFDVRRTPCTTCIYRKDSPLSLAQLEDEIADPHMTGFFTTYRVCHYAPQHRPVCCAGFWRRHARSFSIGQVAQRLGLVRMVDLNDDLGSS